VPALAHRLAALLADGGRVSDAEAILDAHATDFSYHGTRRPDAVVFPRTTEDVSAVLAFAHANEVPVVAFAAGTSLEGHVIPAAGGISLDLTAMDRVLELRPADLLAVCQPGLTRSALNARAVEHGLFFPVDPGADASLGGMAATNASGTTTVRYGGMRAHVLALEVALADGSVVRTGSRAAKTSAGYALTHLFVGSEGTLGVITELTVRLHGVPEHVVAARIVFEQLEDACAAAVTLASSGLAVSRAELIDAATVRAVNGYKQTSFTEAPSLFLELAGSQAGVEGDLAAARELAEDAGGTGWTLERETEARSRLWEARHHALFAVQHLAPGRVYMATDVCLPLSELPEAIRRARVAADRLAFPSSIVAHAADGNYHVLVMLDPDDPDERAAAEALNDEIVRWALERGGTCTGEHGIGQGKIRYLEREHADLLPLLRGVKQLLDPRGILNPGKILREA
jgi:D-lactate dehydrogenase (cytochrome)